MSLYDDIEVPVDAREKAQQSSNIATEAAKKADLQAKSMNLSFLKSQLEAKKAMQNSQRISNVPSPAVDFGVSGNQQKPVRKSLLNLKPRKAIPLTPIDSTSSFSIVPKALTEDKVFLFGEFNVEDEYNPTAPTDYASFKTKREAQRVKEKIAKEIADRILKQHEEEESKRKSGACFAPPQNLIEQDMAPPPTPSPPVVYESPSQFGKKSASRGLDVAANIMKNMGYREGFGLGRDEQGMSTALRVEKTGKTGLIIAETATQQIEDDDVIEVGTGFSVSTEKTVAVVANITEMLKNSSKIVLLKNMVLPSEVDSDLEGEIKEEMKKYGQLNNVIIHSMPNASTDEAVRIFLEFTNVNHAIKAVVDLNGRFFGGRAIHPEFYSLDNYMDRKLNE